MRIAHLSDPHVNQQYHPAHIKRLQAALEHALASGAEHIVVSGDLTSTGDVRDLRATRQLFARLDILKSSKLTLVVGNHDIFGGPHLAEELLNFPEHCKQTEYDEMLARFQDHFSELFTGTITADGSAYPYLKRIRKTCFMGINSVARYARLENPVGSNGLIYDEDRTRIRALASSHEWQTATQRIVVLHHHLFRKRDIGHLNIEDGTPGAGIFGLLERGTLKLHGKRRILALLEEIGTDLVLHGHVHFTGFYERNGIHCVNSAGAVYPSSKSSELKYHMIELRPLVRTIEAVPVPVSTAVTERNVRNAAPKTVPMPPTFQQSALDRDAATAM